jgi:hypothetical protein
MLDSKENERSFANEAAVKEQFEKFGYVIKKLDNKASKRKRPEFLISNQAGHPQMLCEVKTVDSGGYPKDKNVHGVAYVHISMRDDELQGHFRNIPITRRKIDDGLASAVNKRAELVADKPSLKDVPLLVAFFFDQLAEYLPFYPRTFGEHLQTPDDEFPPFREVSGILTLKEDVVVPESFETLSDTGKGEFLRNALTSGLPRRTDFVLVKNHAALRVVPEDFECLCLPAA